MYKVTIILFYLATASLIQLGSCQQDSCPFVTAPDGSKYDISNIAYRVYQYVYSNNGQTYTYNMSICAPLPSPCSGACISPNSAGVCQMWGPAPTNAKCYGSYTTGQIVGLTNGAGVRITYQNGDVCGTCNPSGPRTSIITLTCSTNIPDPNQILWTGFTPDGPGTPPVTYFNGNISCGNANHVTIQYFGYGSGCNGTDAYMVTVNSTRTCTVGCQMLGNRYVFTDCDDTVRLPSGTWIEQLNSAKESCDTPQSAVYTKSNLCSGSFKFSYQECDANTVYTYSCNSPFCNQCTLSSKTPTNTCSNGTEYQCASDKHASAAEKMLFLSGNLVLVFFSLIN